jgi:hypothetical protein
MVLRLRPIRDHEFPAFVVASRREYADDIERNAHVPRDEAREKAQRDFATLFPGDRPAESQTVLVVEDEETGEAVGRVWFAARQHLGGRRRSCSTSRSTGEHRLRGRGLACVDCVAAETSGQRHAGQLTVPA